MMSATLLAYHGFMGSAAQLQAHARLEQTIQPASGWRVQYVNAANPRRRFWPFWPARFPAILAEDLDVYRKLTANYTHAGALGFSAGANFVFQLMFRFGDQKAPLTPAPDWQPALRFGVAYAGQHQAYRAFAWETLRQPPPLLILYSEDDPHCGPDHALPIYAAHKKLAPTRVVNLGPGGHHYLAEQSAPFVLQAIQQWGGV